MGDAETSTAITPGSRTRVRISLLVIALVLTITATAQSISASRADRLGAESYGSAAVSGASSAGIRNYTAEAVALNSAPDVPLRRIAGATPGCGINVSTDASTRPPRGCRILVIGDSLGNNLGAGLRRQLREVAGVRLAVRSKASTGLSNSWFYDWPDHLAPLLSEIKPHLVLVMIGANDHQNMKVRGKILVFGSPGWIAEYQSRVRQITSLSRVHGAYIVWVGLPVMAPPRYKRAMRDINRFAAAVIAQQRGAQFVSTWDYFATPSGDYRESAVVNGRLSTLRHPDGIHFSSIGEDVLSTYVARQLTATLHIYLVGKHPRSINR